MSLLRKNVLTLGIGVLLIALTVLVFLSLSSKESMNTIGFSTSLTAELVSVVAFLFFNKASMNSSRVMVLAGAYTAIFMYLFVSLTLSVVFMVYVRSEEKALLTVEASLLAMLLIVLTLICSHGKRLSKLDDVTTKQMAAMGVLESNVKLMRDHPANSQYNRQMNEIYEAIRNSDQSVYIKTDEVVSSHLYDLHLLLQSPNPSSDKVAELSDIILHLINRRTLEVRQAKKGGI